MKKPFALALSLAFVCNFNALPGKTCSFGGGPYFTYTIHPDFPMSKFSAGQLGILQNGYARSYLMVAWRYLSNKPLSAQEQDAFNKLWESRLAINDFSCAAVTDSWIKLRATVPGVSKLES
ncbi:MAG: hypothetical protein JST89_26740, partial [Cyanobacteria bacterium SZAS-4]|nr:hypothetical protein [Cyanobacteria bacterium SZAS-4]